MRRKSALSFLTRVLRALREVNWGEGHRELCSLWDPTPTWNFSKPGQAVPFYPCAAGHGWVLSPSKPLRNKHLHTCLPSLPGPGLGLPRWSHAGLSPPLHPESRVVKSQNSEATLPGHKPYQPPPAVPPAASSSPPSASVSPAESENQNLPPVVLVGQAERGEWHLAPCDTCPGLPRSSPSPSNAASPPPYHHFETLCFTRLFSIGHHSANATGTSATLHPQSLESEPLVREDVYTELCFLFTRRQVI